MKTLGGLLLDALVAVAAAVVLWWAVLNAVVRSAP